MATKCGIPRITLLGVELDWAALQACPEGLGRLMSAEARNTWMPCPLPVLDELGNSYQGGVDHGLWQSMVNPLQHEERVGLVANILRVSRAGSFINRLRPWNGMCFDGLDPFDFHAVISLAPVERVCRGKSNGICFHAEIVGYAQCPADGTLAPLLVRHVTHDPFKNPEARLGRGECKRSRHC